MTMRIGLVLGFLLAMLGGCAIHPPSPVPVADMCGFVRHSLEVEIPGDSTPAAEPLPSLADAVGSALASGAGARGDGHAMLFLSGGSLHGAFGAGFLDGVANSSDGLPRFRVVT